MSQRVTRRSRLDSELLILVPILSLLLVAGVAALGSQVSSGEFDGISGALAGVHSVLKLAFYVLMVTLLLVRKGARTAGPARRASVAAYVGTFTPFLLIANGDHRAGAGLTAVAVVVTTVGLVSSVYALGWLGRSFGVVPQARELVRSGPYRYVRHPLYVAEFITFIGAYLTMVTPFSTLVLALFVTMQSYRAVQEENVLKEAFPEYESYMQQAGRFTPRLSALGRAERRDAALSPLAP
jgi:protein-S-isoprenylcysteine O-methyltransferase Ste14